MQATRRDIWLINAAALVVLLGAADGATAQERRFFSEEPKQAAPSDQKPLACQGPITQVIDVGDESLRATKAVFGTNPGGGEGGQFDKTPVLSAPVKLVQGSCLDAHLSAIIGGKPTYGSVSPLALFQVSLTRVSPALGPLHMVGHYETPYGIKSPAVALEAERDVDMVAANFFQRVGTGPHEVPPGNYRVDVWWAGAPPPATPGGAIGAAFVLKLYVR